jgi:Tfp pilus assembly protein PilF
LDRAETEAKAALEGNPKLPAVRGVLAQVYAARGLLEQAEVQAKEAIKLQAANPASAPYHFVLGVIYQRQGKIGEAAQEMQAALRLNPNFGAAREVLKTIGAKIPTR